MVKEKLQEFTVRITQANRSELVVIMYDIIIADIDYAKELMEKGNKEQYVKECRHAQKVLNELMATLDYQYAMSYDLLSLYSYVNKRLVAGCMKYDVNELSEAVLVIDKLRDGFSAVSKQDTTGPVMANTQQVYAGLTYGKGTLNESAIGLNDINRGFMA